MSQQSPMVSAIGTQEKRPRHDWGHDPVTPRRACTAVQEEVANLVRLGLRLMAAVILTVLAQTATASVARGDNFRLNNGVVAHVYALQQLSGCPKELHVNPQLRQAAQWHTLDMLNNRGLDGDVGSDGSTPPDRALSAGYAGRVAETVSINPASMAGSAFASNGIEVIKQWQSNPASLAIMTSCANTQIGVWSENSLDRMIVVAVYGTEEQ